MNIHALNNITKINIDLSPQIKEYTHFPGFVNNTDKLECYDPILKIYYTTSAKDKKINEMTMCIETHNYPILIIKTYNKNNEKMYDRSSMLKKKIEGLKNKLQNEIEQYIELQPIQPFTSVMINNKKGVITKVDLDDNLNLHFKWRRFCKNGTLHKTESKVPKGEIQIVPSDLHAI